MSETDFLKLKKHDNPETNTEKFDIENYLNGNWDKINENAKKVNTDISNINSKNKEQDTNIEQLQENTETSSNKIAELEKELKEAQEDFYQNSIRGQASGEYIHVEDSSNCRAKIGIGGNQKQETREGYNQLKNEGTTQTLNNVTITKKEDETLVVNGTATEDFIFSIKRNIELEDGEQYKLSGCPNGGDEKKYALTINQYYENQSHFGQDYGDGVNFTYNGSLPINNNIYIRLFKGIKYNNLIFKPMIVKGTEQKPYEQYGVMPSPDYPSEVKSVGSNVNIFDGEIEKGGINYQNGNVESATDRIRSKNFIEVDPNFQYTINRLDSNGKGLAIRGYDKDKNYVGYIGVNTNKKITFIPQTYSNTDMPHPNTKFYYMKFIDLDNNLNARYKIEKGKVATPYSKYGQGSVKVTKYNKNIFKETYNRKDATSAFASIVKGECFLEKDKTYVVSFDTTNNGGTVYLGEDFFQYINAYTVKCDGTRKFFTVKAKKFGYVTDITVLKTRVDTTNAYNISNVMISEYENDTDTEYIQHEEQSYIMPTQQSMKSTEDIRDTFIKKDGKWYERHNINRRIFDGTTNKFVRTSGTANNLFVTNTFEDGNIIVPSTYGENVQHFNNYFQTNYSSDGLFANGQYVGSAIRPTDDMVMGFGKESEINTVDKANAWLKAKYDAGAPLYVDYLLETPIDLECTEEQSKILDELNNARTYKNITNITTDSKAILSLDYAKDLETLLNNTQALAVNNASEGV